jgi:CubicO group peptidase (beta-lactamase class C family)
MAVAVGDNEPIVRVHGYADLASENRLTANTPLPLASITKQMTAACAVVLDERGVMKLDDPIGHYVEKLPSRTGKPTIRQLLSHRSGLRCHLDHTLFSGVGKRPAGFSMRAIRACSTVNAEPDELLVYGNSGFHLVARAIESATKRDFASAMSEMIFAPLAMTSTRIVPEGAGVERGLASLYMPSESGWIDVSELRHESLGEGGGWSTVGDLLIWMRALRLEDARLSKKVWRSLKTLSQLPDETMSYYGLGLSLSSYRGLKIVGHGGAIAGANGAVISAVDYPVDIALLSNCMIQADRFAKRLLVAAVGEGSIEPVASDAAAADHAGFIGKVFGNEQITVALLDSNGALAMSLQGCPPFNLQEGRVLGKLTFEGGLSSSSIHFDPNEGDAANGYVDLQFGGRMHRLHELTSTQSELESTCASAVGEYVNGELDYRLRLEREGGGLRAYSTGPYGEWHGSAKPLAANILTLSGEWFAGILRLRRQGDLVVGLEFGTTRTYGLEFKRLA